MIQQIAKMTTTMPISLVVNKFLDPLRLANNTGSVARAYEVFLCQIQLGLLV